MSYVAVLLAGNTISRETAMKLSLFALGALTVTALTGTPAAAQNYPWCAYYSDDFGGTNCGFVSYEQCMATVTGIGGFCDQNTQYVPPGPHPVQRARKQRSSYGKAS
jgi:hypothetical protein